MLFVPENNKTKTADVSIRAPQHITCPWSLDWICWGLLSLATLCCPSITSWQELAESASITRDTFQPYLWKCSFCKKLVFFFSKAEWNCLRAPTFFLLSVLKTPHPHTPHPYKWTPTTNLVYIHSCEKELKKQSVFFFISLHTKNKSKTKQKNRGYFVLTEVQYKYCKRASVALKDCLRCCITNYKL